MNRRDFELLFIKSLATDVFLSLFMNESLTWPVAACTISQGCDCAQ